MPCGTPAAASPVPSRLVPLALTLFVGGLIAMFVPLGLVAGLTGSVFGSLLSNRWVNLVIGLVFLALAASMFGAFELQLLRRLLAADFRGAWAHVDGGFLLALLAVLMTASFPAPAAVNAPTRITDVTSNNEPLLLDLMGHLTHRVLRYLTG